MFVTKWILSGLLAVFVLSSPCFTIEHVEHIAALHSHEPVEKNVIDEGKRSPKSFYAWNGKRSEMHGMHPMDSVQQEHESQIEQGKRGQPKSFYSWNGKRNGLQHSSKHRSEFPVAESEEGEVGKRAPKSFYAWNGKRSSDHEESLHSANILEGKRAPKSFYAWNGKRNAYLHPGLVEDRLEEGKRNPKSFYAWNGKRGKWHPPSYQMKYGYGKRAPKSFYAWNGKRAPKSFYAWNGKRNGAESEEESFREEPVMMEGKRAPKSFYAWNGKRAPKSFYAWNGKRAPKSFYAWNGKRSEGAPMTESEEEREERHREEYEPIHQEGKRAPKSFYAWNGKRTSSPVEGGGSAGESHEEMIQALASPHHRAKRSYAPLEESSWEGPRFVPNHFYGMNGPKVMAGDLMPQPSPYRDDPYADHLNDVIMHVENEPKRKFYHFSPNQDPFDL